MKWEYDDLVVILQGNVRVDTKLVESAWSGFHVIWSTWVDQKINTTNKVIYSEYPTLFGVGNIGLQKVSTYEGLLYAKEAGFKRAIKWRSDQYPTNAKKLSDIMDPNSLNLLYWHNHERGYYVDYFMEGDIDILLDIWNFNEFTNYPYSEYKTTQQIIQSKTNVHCIGDELNDDNDILWTGPNTEKRLSTYKFDGLFQSLNINKHE